MPSLFLPCEKPPAVSGPGWKTFVPAGALPTVETVQKVDALHTAAGREDWGGTFWVTETAVAFSNFSQLFPHFANLG